MHTQNYDKLVQKITRIVKKGKALCEALKIIQKEEGLTEKEANELWRKASSILHECE